MERLAPDDRMSGVEIFWTPWVIVAVAGLDVFAIAQVLLRAHGVEGSLSWILAILAFPGFGAAAYLGFAHPRIAPTTRRKQSTARHVREQVAEPAPSPPEVRGDALERTVVALTELQSRPGNKVQLLADNEEAFETIEEELANAQESLWVEYYLLRNDSTGRRFLELLAERARAGVDVRLLYDGLGSVGLSGLALEQLRAAGASTQVFLPMNPMRRRWSIHLRNHRKLIVVDGRTAFTGGMNVGDEYSGRSRLRGLQHFHDTHLRLEGPAARDMALIFAEDWAFSTGEQLPLPPVPPEQLGGARISVVPSGPDQRINASRLLYFTAMGEAEERIWLTSPYFVPDTATRMAMIGAAVRGVDVRLLLPARSDVRLVGTAARAFFEELVAAGVRIFEYQPSMLHAKTLVVDGDTSIVGSANVDMRSFRWNFELSVLVSCPHFARDLEARFEKDLEVSREVLEKDLRELGVVQRIGRGAASLLSPML